MQVEPDPRFSDPQLSHHSNRFKVQPVEVPEARDVGHRAAMIRQKLSSEIFKLPSSHLSSHKLGHGQAVTVRGEYAPQVRFPAYA